MFSILGFGGRLLRYAVRSPKWKTVRKNHLQNHNKCAACGSNRDLEVHHIIPVHMDPSKELDVDNLVTLCSNSCHLLFGHLMDFKSYNATVLKDCANMYGKILDRPY